MAETFVQTGKQELCGAVPKREEDLPGLVQYRDRISSIAGHLVRATDLLIGLLLREQILRKSRLLKNAIITLLLALPIFCYLG